jgi:hypothetical protein
LYLLNKSARKAELAYVLVINIGRGSEPHHDEEHRFSMIA